MVAYPHPTDERHSQVRRTTAIALVLALLFTLLSLATAVTPARASASNSCDGSAANDQNSIRVTASHGNVFYIHSPQGQNIDASSASYHVQNRDASHARGTD